MPAKKNPLGATGEAVRSNVARHRKRLNLTYADLARRLESGGRPIAVLGLSRIEAGERRVDADDLMALAYALEVNPHALLIPPIDTRDGEPASVAVTGFSSPVPGEQLWQWLDGSRPLFNPAEDARAFTGRTRPAWRRTVDPDGADRDALRRQLEDARLAILNAQQAIEELGTDGDD
ncbi:helix-turn-helix domain-containing protein [Nocardia cyriacigeorgica]|uniref:helix-turn-helix domain-containing protein n=1 Tax=Nocardia cyriacigeorgica TaxID=135487 RepID=UPI002455846A|nr:helix-turn-helix transcriptional regulator [Nocardia cyriacigeorgica]